MSRGRRRGAGLLLGAVLALAGCSGGSEHAAKVPGRWYTPAEVARGERVFVANCQRCHGEKAASVPDWRERGADGHFPPPPLNDDGPAWHHSLKDLMRIIAVGGRRADGRMPAFRDRLSVDERRAVIAYIQSLWSKETYRIWSREVGQGS